MRRKAAPITLARIAADIIDGTQLPAIVLAPGETLELVKPASAGKTEQFVADLLELLGAAASAAGKVDDAETLATLRHRLAGLELPPAIVPRDIAEELGERISVAWGMIKAHDSTGTVTIQENAEGHWYAIWCDHAGAVIAESSPVTSPEQAEKLVLWMRDNAAAARQEILEGAYREALELAARAPTTPPPELAHLASTPPAEENAHG